MTCNSSFVAEFDVQVRPRDTLCRSNNRYESKNRSADRFHRASLKTAFLSYLCHVFST
jgi:hypothetical protein